MYIVNRKVMKCYKKGISVTVKCINILYGNDKIVVESRGDEITIKEIKKQLNLRSDELAAELGMSRVTYYNKLKGKTEWTINELIALAELIHWKPVEIEVNGRKYRIKISRKKIA